MNPHSSATSAGEVVSAFDAVAYAYAHAHPEFYAPLWQVTDVGREFAPSSVPPGWSAERHHIWTAWGASDVIMPDEGWKIHVSARLARAPDVLDIVADACFSERVRFKHLHAELFFLYLHHKHGPRQQAGKFCVAFPSDEAAARQLLDRLEIALAGEEGPYVLTDRRYRDSRTVHYRWGAFRSRVRRRPDGTREPLVRDGFGRDTVDLRGPSFVLPDGISDPFAPDAPSKPRGPVVLRGYEIVRAIRPSNAGGTYEARDIRAGRRVFLKEARAHNGLNWDRSTAQERLRREHEVLVTLHAAAPGVCPEPLDYFREWEHEFLVTEFVEGLTLNRWQALHSPVVRRDADAVDFSAYYARCERMLRDLDRTLGRIHRIGYRFGDVSPGNILVAADDRVRLVDFEAASHRDQPPIRLGTDGYVPPGDAIYNEAFAGDAYGMDAIALAMIMPLHSVMGKRPANLQLLRRDVERQAPVPAWLWNRARRCYDGQDLRPDGRLPSPDELDGQPLESLERFAEMIRSALLAMADPGHPGQMFPTIPRGFQTNATCVAYGSAGVLHALHLSGSTIRTDVLTRFRRDAMDARSQLPPGLHVGSAGAAWVLAELGFVDEAITLLDEADRHPLVLLSTTLGEGVAGVGMAHLAMHHQTGDQRSLDLAVVAGDAILATTDLVPTLGDNDAIGLLHGRAGLALFLYYLARDTTQDQYLEVGRNLLYQELKRAISMPDGTLLFPDNAIVDTASPYLFAGSAGVAMVLTRYVATARDERLATALAQIIDSLRTRCAMLPGLYSGLAGMAFALAEHADWAGEPSDHKSAVSVATGLVKYAIPHQPGVRFLGDRSNQRYSAELWSGAAGVLLSLHRVLHAAADHFFTLDHDRSATAPQLSCFSAAPSATGSDHTETIRKEVTT